MKKPDIVAEPVPTMLSSDIPDLHDVRLTQVHPALLGDVMNRINDQTDAMLVVAAFQSAI